MLVRSEAISLFIPGKPVAFARARSNGKRRFTPQAQAMYMEGVGHIAIAAMRNAGHGPFVGPLAAIYRATFTHPPSWPAKRAATTHWKTSKPDIDNAAKLVLDALNGIVFTDDAQIASLMAEKVYGPLEGVTLTVMPLTQARAA